MPFAGAVRRVRSLEPRRRERPAARRWRNRPCPEARGRRDHRGARLPESPLLPRPPTRAPTRTPTPPGAATRPCPGGAPAGRRTRPGLRTTPTEGMRESPVPQAHLPHARLGLAGEEDLVAHLLGVAADVRHGGAVIEQHHELLPAPQLL